MDPFTAVPLVSDPKRLLLDLDDRFVSSQPVAWTLIRTFGIQRPVIRSEAAGMPPMPRPYASPVQLSPEQRHTLIALVRARSTPQAMVLRCRIVSAAAQPEQPTNQQVADTLDCNRHTVGRWRERYVAHGLTGLQDAPRSGRPRTFSPRPTTPGHHSRQ